MPKGPRMFVWGIVLALAAITLYQLVGYVKGSDAPADAGTMLYEASLFQVELLSGFVAEGAQAAATEDLDGLKQAAYSVEYTHGRLVQAIGRGVPKLDSVKMLMEFIVRLQIGGNRQLKPEEIELFTAIAPYFLEMHDAYGDLYSGGRLNDAAAERLRKADEAAVKRLTGRVR